jgi:hypothetical protein
MNRRAFAAGLGAALLAGGTRGVAADCRVIAPGVTGCTSALASTFRIVTQDCPERCWAASIAGIFGYHGHPISQDAIARTMFGTLACLPSGNTTVLDAVLSRQWVDAKGDEFGARISGLYDPLNGVRAINNAELIAELENDKPILYCNRTHAMVVVGMSYRRDAIGNLVVDQVRVADPYPGLGFHLLSPREMAPVDLGGDLLFLASVDVD